MILKIKKKIKSPNNCDFVVHIEILVKNPLQIFTEFHVYISILAISEKKMQNQLSLEKHWHRDRNKSS